MRLRILLFFLLLLLFNPSSQGVFSFLKKAFDFVTGSNPLCQVGLTINSLVQLRMADPNSKLAVEMLTSLGEAFANHEQVFNHNMNKLHSSLNKQLGLTKDLIHKFEKYEQVFDYRMNDLHSTVTLQFFQEKVIYPAHNIFMTATKYINNPNKFMEQLLLNECLKHTPYTRLNDLNTMISNKWFIKQAEHANYRLPDVESIRMHIYNVMKELLFSHFICMAIQNEPVEGSSITDTVRSSVANIIETIDKELKIIENTFFPDYVVKEVQKLIEETPVPENDIKRRITMAEVTYNMLKNTYGPGIVVDSKNNSLFVRDYEVQANKFEPQGKMPEKAVVNIKVKHGYNITITRADRFGVDPDFDPDSYVDRLSFYGENDWGISFQPDLFTEDVLALTWYYLDDRITRCPRKSVYPTLKYSKDEKWGIAVAGAYLDKPINPTPSVSFELKEEQEMAAIQDLRIAVQAELIAVKEAINSGSSVTTQWLLSTVILVICWTVLF